MRHALRLLAIALMGSTVAVVWLREPSGTTAFFTSGFPDCEAFRSGWLAQPSLAQTSLLFGAVGVWMVGDTRTDLRGAALLGLATVVVGLGSFLGHARPDEWARTFDAVGVKLVVLAFLGYGLFRLRGPEVWPWLAGTMAAVIAIEVVVPAAGDVVLAMAGLGASLVTWRVVDSGKRRWLLAGGGTLGLGLVAWWLGRAESSLCTAESSLQFHALWHILAATAIALFYAAYRDEVP